MRGRQAEPLAENNNPGGEFMLNKMLTISEVAEITRLSRATLYAYVSRREIPFYKLGTRTMFKMEEIENWISVRSVKSLTASGDSE
jgi:excisionase family DNA binding protein